MKFGAPYMAVFLWIVPGIGIFYLLANRFRRKTLEKFASGNPLSVISLSYDFRRRRIKNALILVAVFFAILSLTRPEWGFKWHEIKHEGIDILVALDTSNSMLAEDVLPNRLERAKLAIKDLVKVLRGDRIGLIAFSGTAFLQCPLTGDYNGFLLSLEDVYVNTIPIGGTSIAKAIYTAIASYETARKKQERVLIIITDGEDLEGRIDKAAAKAKEKGVKIFCVGIGSEKGELIPIVDEKKKVVFLKDLEGNVVKTRLVEETLERIALETGGTYVRASGTESGPALIYNERLAKMEKQEFKSRMEKRYNERFQFALAFTIVLLLIEPLVGDRKKGLSNCKLT